MTDKNGLSGEYAELELEIVPLPQRAIGSRDECLGQLIGAFHDIAEFDDIHQAAERLRAVQDWIRREARAAADDPIFRGDVAEDFRRDRVVA